jgi:hypothetical protein
MVGSDDSQKMNQAMQATAQATAKTESKTEEAVPDNAAAETRKLFLSAQKAERKAKEMEKKAAASLSRADAFDKAVKMTQQGGDPTAVLTAAGIDPIKFYQDMTQHVLKEPVKKETAQEKQLREHEQRLNEYAKTLEVQANTQKEKEELATHNKNITEQVIPLLQNNPDRYESLLIEYGANAATEVYKAVWERYQLTGEIVPFQQAADNMEEYWAKQIESGINAASKMKKFSNRFAAAEQTRQNPVQKETPNRTFTLSNQQTSQAAPASGGKKKPPANLTWEERANWYTNNL